MKSELCKGKVLLIRFPVEVWIERDEYFHKCFESTVMQVTYNCFILLDLANNVRVLPLPAEMLSCIAQLSVPI